MSTRTAVVVAVLAVVGLVLSITAAWSRLAPEHTVRDEPGPPVAVESPALPLPATAFPSPLSRRSAALGAAAEPLGARPVRVALGSIGINAVVRPVGVAGDAQMQLPPDPRVIGWYEFGPAPASGTGSVVLAGHLDSRRFGVGPLVRLRDVEVGDPVEVLSSDGVTSTYRVVRVERFDQQALPAEIFARTGPERLRVVTCGGAYDPETGYEKNLVVTAVPG
jgi:hypothetical protein